MDPAPCSCLAVKPVGERIWLTFGPFLTTCGSLTVATKSSDNQCYKGEGSSLREAVSGGVGQGCCFHRIDRGVLSG